MDISLQLAGILGPVLIVLSVTEYKNFAIWRDIHPSVVYLNGLVFLTGGMVVVRLHNFWRLDWTVLITIPGWLLLLLGLYRMVWPAGKQVEKPLVANLIFLMMFFLGVFLAMKAYLFR
jgi:hypothetical protein